MKSRRKVYRLCHTIKDYLYNNLFEQHDHTQFELKGTGCMLCRLIEHGRVFASLQLAREFGYCTDWLPAELDLYNLIGADTIRAKTVREMEWVRALPKYRCSGCNGIITWFMSWRELTYQFLHNRQPKRYLLCQLCGYENTVTRHIIKSRKLWRWMRRRIAVAAPRKRPIADL